MNSPLRLRRIAPSATTSSSRALSFADLMIHLLSFFVLLFAWSKPIDGARFSEGLGGFLHYLDSWGLPADEIEEQARDARIREVAGRLRDFSPRAELRPRRPEKALSTVLPFAEDALLPGVAHFAPRSAELEREEHLAVLARSLSSQPGWFVRLEVCSAHGAEAIAMALAEQRLISARQFLIDAGCTADRIILSLVNTETPRAPDRLDLRLLRDLRSP